MLRALILLSLAVVCYCAIETYPLDKFPKDKVALHMPCEESNMFATKCMCHLKCTDINCKNAKELCEKYEKSKGCKYMLIRGNKNKIATLKRVPTAKELAVFDISMYPNNTDFLSEPKWKKLHEKQIDLNKKGPKIKDLVKRLGERGDKIVSKLFEQKMKNNYCGKKYFEEKNTNRSSEELATLKESFLNRGIAMTALSYHSPMTLVNSMRTWNSSGFLQLLSESHIILNDPLPAEHSMALDHGIKVLQPKDIRNAKINKPNVVTIGAAFFYALQNVQSEYLIFLENDFKMDTSLSVNDIAAQLVTAAGMLESGAEIVRLQSKKYQGCGTFKDCQHHGIHLDSSAPRERMRNWFAFYCKETEKDRGRTDKWVSDCFSQPDYRCFTSWDTNWTLNAVMVKKSTMFSKKYNTGENLMKSIAQIGLDQYQKQDGFESVMALSFPWPNWKVPICLSYEGLFIHEEIETST